MQFLSRKRDAESLLPHFSRLTQRLSLGVSFGVLSSVFAPYAFADAVQEAPAAADRSPASLPALAPSTERAGSSAQDYVPTASYFHGSVGFEADGYLYSPRTKTPEIYPMLLIRPEAFTEHGYFEAFGKADTVFMTSLSNKDKPEAYFELPEGYFGTSSRLENIKLSLGRKLEDWNHLDEFWELGIWQPRFRWDYLRPDEVALTGLNVELEQPFVKLTLFGSLLFVPERGVPVSNQNGSLISTSPWFISPPSNLVILSQTTPLDYQLQIPTLSQLLFHPSLSGMLRIGDEMGPWLSTAVAYKPMNQLLLAYNGYLPINGNSNSTDPAVVPIVARVIYHTLISAEAGFSSEVYSGWLSLLFDRPGKEVTPQLDSSWTLQTVSPSFAMSPAFEFHITDPNSNVMRVVMSYLYQTGGNAADTASGGGNAISTGGLSVFEPRYPFQNAVKFKGQLELPDFATFLQGMTIFSGSVLYDIRNVGMIITADAKYRPSPRWEYDLGVDLIGNDEALNTNPTDFIGQYRGDDRIRAGVTYVF